MLERKCKLVNSNFIKVYNVSAKGFTLIEVLIAIMLLAFVSLYTFKMVSTSIDTKDIVLKEDQEIVQGLTAISRIDSDFSQMYSPLYSYSKSNPTQDTSNLYQDTSPASGNFNGKTKNGQLIPQIQTIDKSTIVFFAAANRRKVSDVKESRFAWIKYSLRKMENLNDEDNKTKTNAGEFELIRQTVGTNIYSNDTDWSEVKSQVLMNNVKSVEFSFWDERAKKFTSSLQDLNENKFMLRSMKMNLIWIDENNHDQHIEKIYRISFPYFNTKLDDVNMSNTGGAYGGSSPPPGLPDPNNPQGQGSQGNGGVHY